ncbi:Uncharacterized protein family UPF0497 [Macleaya cordata]|uniref:CASP-like protein n=1 Tax=Macleaya cordata TaxID=56857 RepID=A0A200R3E7_MACCD|nr:Uncharacterized protein family UPF0497 [Macleaya cordata]
MANSEDATSTKGPNYVEAPPVQRAAPPADVEGGKSSSSSSSTNRIGGSSWILRRWKREDLLKKGCLILRASALLFSLLSFIIMATNKHGDWKNFDRYEEYSRYLLAIAILSTLYTGGQVLRQIHQFSTGKAIFEQRTTGFADFFGDQIISYLLISAASTAVPMTNRMREGSDNIFTDALAASISMAFLGFFALALSAMISGFKLSTQTYI